MLPMPRYRAMNWDSCRLAIELSEATSHKETVFGALRPWNFSSEAVSAVSKGTSCCTPALCTCSGRPRRRGGSSRKKTPALTD